MYYDDYLCNYTIHFRAQFVGYRNVVNLLLINNNLFISIHRGFAFLYYTNRQPDSIRYLWFCFTTIKGVLLARFASRRQVCLYLSDRKNVNCVCKTFKLILEFSKTTLSKQYDKLKFSK